jgi:hypothetical protein
VATVQECHKTQQFTLVFETQAQQRLEGVFMLQGEGMASELVYLQSGEAGQASSSFNLLKA